MDAAQVRLVGLAIALAACGAASPEEPAPIAETSGIECLGGIDTVDRCPTVPYACIASYRPDADDGCPDPAYPFPVARFEPTSIELSPEAMGVASGICLDELWPGASLRLVAVGDGLRAERIAALRAALVACGVPAERIREGGAVPAPGPGGVYAVDDVVVAVDDCAP